MSIRLRLIFMLVSFVVLVSIGVFSTGGFQFLITQFWFTSGFFLLLLLSLIDQPHFSKDANVFVNGATAGVSLLLVSNTDRTGVWWVFFGWSIYLVVSSYVLMWIRRNVVWAENSLVRSVSRLNMEIGRPEAIFSAFFLWGCVLQFGIGAVQLNALFLFWAVFMIVNLPGIASAIESVFSRFGIRRIESNGTLIGLTNPRVAEVALDHDLADGLLGRDATLFTTSGRPAAQGILIDDRVISGRRIARVAITNQLENWTELSQGNGNFVSIGDQHVPGVDGRSAPIGVVDAGTEIGKLVFHVHPNQAPQAGEVLSVMTRAGSNSYFQVISARVCELTASDNNHLHTVKVEAGQLGRWVAKDSRFEPMMSVVPAGELILRYSNNPETIGGVPGGHESIGTIPLSDFPVHVDLDDIVTHNAAVIGVTGSGKSFLSFHLIEAMARTGIKVLILDISRQHDLYLRDLNPTALKSAADVSAWIDSGSMIGIHQFATATEGYPKATSDFVSFAFQKVMSSVTLQRGRNIPAKLCVVLEEAHSLIPEWNQVSDQKDKDWVNKTARTILQGRKYGMGTLLITQRTANVVKTILNQCNTIFAFQSFDQTGLDFLGNYMGAEYSHALSTLPTRHAIVVGKASSSTRPLLFNVTDLTERWKEAAQEEVEGQIVSRDNRQDEAIDLPPELGVVLE